MCAFAYTRSGVIKKAHMYSFIHMCFLFYIRTVVYVDLEFTFDTSFAKKLGVQVDNLVISQPSSLQETFKVIDSLIDAGVDVIVLDSIAALVPEEELEAEPGKQTVGLVARYMSQFLRRVTSKLAHSGGILVCINQTREKIGVMWGDNTTTGGGRKIA